MNGLRGLLFLSLGTLPLIAPAADLGAANAFNAFIFNNADLHGSDSFGAIAVGNNLTLDNYQVNARNLGVNLPGMSNIGLLVGNTLTAQGGAARVERGDAFVRNGVSSGNLLFNGGTLRTGAAVSTGVFATQQAYSISQTSAIAGLTSTAFATALDASSTSNNLKINLANVATVNGRKTIKVDGGLFSSAKTLDIMNAGSETVIFDVTGGSSVNWNWNINTSNASKLLWNFSTQTNLTISKEWKGSILAPTATVVQNEVINGGNLIAFNWTANQRELHFAGDTTPFGGNAPVPEPASLTALGLGAAAFLRRRRAK